jgi:hypothetical protein
LSRRSAGHIFYEKGASQIQVTLKYRGSTFRVLDNVSTFGHLKNPQIYLLSMKRPLRVQRETLESGFSGFEFVISE